MLEAADEHEPLALGERLAAAHRLVDVRQQQHARLGHELAQDVTLDRRHDERDVDAPDQRQLLVARDRAAIRAPAPSSSSASRSARRKCRSTVSNTRSACGANWRTASMCLRRDVVARQHDDVELAPALGDQLADRADVRSEQHFDAALLQLPHVRLPMLEVVGDERDLAAGLDHQLEHRQHAHRAGILVRA